MELDLNKWKEVTRQQNSSRNNPNLEMKSIAIGVRQKGKGELEGEENNESMISNFVEGRVNC